MNDIFNRDLSGETVSLTTKLSHLEENIRSMEFDVSSAEWRELEMSVSAIPVSGERYNAEQQSQVGH